MLQFGSPPSLLGHAVTHVSAHCSGGTRAFQMEMHTWGPTTGTVEAWSFLLHDNCMQGRPAAPALGPQLGGMGAPKPTHHSGTHPDCQTAHTVF